MVLGYLLGGLTLGKRWLIRLNATQYLLAYSLHSTLTCPGTQVPSLVTLITYLILSSKIAQNKALK